MTEPITCGRYTLHEQLGKGGFGTVYRATDKDSQVVAIKVLEPELINDAAAVERFRKDFMSTKSIIHLHIADLFEIGESESNLYIVTRYIEGTSLDQVLKERGKLPLVEAIRILKDLAEGLQFAHDRGFVHRDIKPSNIIISPVEGAVLTDLGLVKSIVSCGLACSNLTISTSAYMAPELLLGKSATPYSDIYSMGCVFYEMLTGKKLFEDDSSADIKTIHELGNIQLEEILPGPLMVILAKTLAKEPRERYSSMAKFWMALQAMGNVEFNSHRKSSEKVVVVNKPNSSRGIIRTEPSQASITPDLELPNIFVPQEINPQASIRTRSPWKILVGVLSFIAILIFVSRVQSQWFGTGINLNITPTETDILHNQPTEIPVVGSTQVSNLEGMVMVYVPEGEFTMGSSYGDNDEKPLHSVYLDAFWIDKTEVTNAMYAKCVVEKRCSEPAKVSSYYRESYFRNPDFENFPVIYVDWEQALTYCKWAGRDLPTEAQWEKAARGSDSRTYPWGEEDPTCDKANVSGCYIDTIKVGNYIYFPSPYSALDMAGNVWEWVKDWYDPDYYRITPYYNPPGPESSTGRRGIRGGSWIQPKGFSYTSANRNGSDPSSTNFNIGFRCALNTSITP